MFEIEPPDGTPFGFGYDVARRRVIGTPCVDFDLNARFKAGEEMSDAGFEIVTSNSAVSDTMSLSVAASISATTPKQSGSVKSKTDVASGSSTNQYSQTMLLYSYNRPSSCPMSG